MAELLVALGISSAVGIMVLVMMVQGLQEIKRRNEQERLHATATFVVDRLGFWVKQADVLTVASPGALEAHLPDGTVKRFELSGVALALDGQPLTDQGITVTGLTFSLLARSVRINLSLEASADSRLSFTTTIAQRNEL